MNDRLPHETTPEGIIAAVVRELISEVTPRPPVPDFADIRDRIKPYLDRELMKARKDEIANALSQESVVKGRVLALTSRAIDLQRGIDALTRQIEEGRSAF